MGLHRQESRVCASSEQTTLRNQEHLQMQLLFDVLKFLRTFTSSNSQLSSRTSSCSHGDTQKWAT
jgi:hypothetical protein